MIYIPVQLFELLSIIDVAFLIFYLLIRKQSKVTEPKVNLRNLGYYLMFMAFAIVFVIRFFANIPSYLVWFQSIIMSMLLFILGWGLVKYE
jgi:prolipoprotein diacylglyceryltransferase